MKSIKENTINKITASDIKEALSIAFGNYGKFAFSHNIEVKDVKKRFRIFLYNGKVYVAKQVDKKDAMQEVLNSSKVAKQINGLSVSGFTLHIIESELIETGKDCFLVSLYRGNTLHEYIYNHKEIPLSQEILLDFFRQILEQGVVLPGFLPRNLIVNGNKLFLLDLENVFYGKEAAKHVTEYISTAEFVNNWSCLYNRCDLVSFFAKYNTNIGKNIKIGSFEREYALLTGCDENKIGLKKEIESIIMVAESGKRVGHSKYMIASDLGHLVSDTFPRCIDVIHDLFLYQLQKEKYRLHKYLILVATYYKFYLARLKTEVAPKKGYLLLPMLLMFDKKIDVISLRDIEKAKNEKELTTLIVNRLPDTCLSRNYLCNKTTVLQTQLASMMQKNIIEQLPITKDRQKRANLAKVIACVQENAKDLSFAD